jgi:hypothetical protein
MVIVAPFYAPRPDHPKFRDYIPLLRLQDRSVRHFGHIQTVLTDSAFVARLFPALRAELPHALMKASHAAQLAALQAGLPGDLVLTGADCLLGRDPAALFDGSFDLAATTHPFSDCILNTGAIFVPKGCGSKVAKFWEQALRTCGDHWGDDQRSLAAALGATLERGLHDRGGLRVKFLPCRDHNWAPDHAEDPCTATVVHFRGPRKDWMAQWMARFQPQA